MLAGAIAAAIGAVLIAIVVIAGPPSPTGGSDTPTGSPQTGDIIAVPTVPHADGEGCRLALLAGTLIVHPVWGVAVDGGSVPQLVFWPKGFSARLTDDGADLLDRDGRVVAHTGDEVRASGGQAEFGGREGFAVCATDLAFEPAQP